MAESLPLRTSGGRISPPRASIHLPMLTTISHATLLVEDCDEALAYYTDVLGFEKRADVMTEFGRWLTVGTPGSESPELVVMEPENDDQRAAVGRQVPDYIAFVIGTDDCDAEYERLREAGVEFESEPEDYPWGREAMFTDLYGNRLDVIEPTEFDESELEASAESAGE